MIPLHEQALRIPHTADAEGNITAPELLLTSSGDRILLFHPRMVISFSTEQAIAVYRAIRMFVTGEPINFPITEWRPASDTGHEADTPNGQVSDPAEDGDAPEAVLEN